MNIAPVTYGKPVEGPRTRGHAGELGGIRRVAAESQAHGDVEFGERGRPVARHGVAKNHGLWRTHAADVVAGNPVDVGHPLRIVPRRDR